MRSDRLRPILLGANFGAIRARIVSRSAVPPNSYTFVYVFDAQTHVAAHAIRVDRVNVTGDDARSGGK